MHGITVCHLGRVRYAVLDDPGVASASSGALDVCACPRKHCFCSLGRVQPEDLQQPGVCRPPGSVRQPGLRGGLPVDPDVHHPHELCQRLGSGIQVRSGCHLSWGPDCTGLKQQSRGPLEIS